MCFEWNGEENQHAHDFAEVTCPHCGTENCHNCCGFDSRPDPAHDPDNAFMRCRECGQEFDV